MHVGRQDGAMDPARRAGQGTEALRRAMLREERREETEAPGEWRLALGGVCVGRLAMWLEDTGASGKD